MLGSIVVNGTVEIAVDCTRLDRFEQRVVARGRHPMLIGEGGHMQSSQLKTWLSPCCKCARVKATDWWLLHALAHAFTTVPYQANDDLRGNRVENVEKCVSCCYG